ncbi:MAG: 2-C-methyl-D-erythritol 2,4-cyclodiphosphate synthase [Clostridia bacterium]|nr:2-C-methyl-D-erythritol 2,4-cyclodiphosphate synthase [Clostridia bacterium]
MIRIGQGYDVHRLVEGRKLIVGGKEIEYEKGLLGHSDADVLTHAICDALLGAAALGDIGKLFPDNDSKFKDINSQILLAEVGNAVSAAGYTINNIDATIIAQAPKFAPHIDDMRKNIADSLKIDISQVGIKATTEEGLGFTGRKEGIAASAVALIIK